MEPLQTNRNHDDHPRRRGLRRYIVSRPALVTLSLAVTLLLLELTCRIVAGYQSGLGLLRELKHEYEPVPKAEQPVPLGTLRRFRLSQNPRIIYELKPGIQFIDSSGRTYTMNDAGFRGPDYPHEKGPRTVRIVGLGDSHMYGNGVSDDEVFLQRLSHELNRKHRDRSWEIINTGVGGYNTVMEVETLKEKGLRYAPDIVLILFVGNDLHLPAFVREPVDLFARQSFLLELVTYSLGRVRGRLSGDGRWFERNLRKVPLAYRDMVGLEAYQEAMRELKALSTHHGFEVIVLQQNYRDYVTEICKELDFPLVHFQPRLNHFMKEHGISGYKGSVLSVSASDAHPSAVSHRMFAEVVLDYLEQSGTIERARLRSEQ